MSRRRVLILSYFFPPLAGGGVHRILGMTRALPRLGWDCTVVCAGPDDYWVRDESLLARVAPGTEVMRVPGGSAIARWLRLRGGGGRRDPGTFDALRRLADWWLVPDPYVGWMGRARAAAGRLVARGGFSALVSTSPPDSVHLAAESLHRRYGIPWLADFRDPWMGLHYRTPPTSWHLRRQAALERRVLEGADVVLVATRAHADTLGARSGGRARRVVHLANGYEPDGVSAPGGAPDRRAPDPDKFLLAFTGTLSQMPDTEVFLEAVHEVLARRPEARRRLRACLAGPHETGYADRAVALGLTGIVEFPGPLAHAESRALQRAADVTLLWKPRVAPTMVPGKLYEYLDAGRPVLALLDEKEDAADLVRRAGGEVLSPGDRAGLAAAIERRYAAWKEHGREPDSRASWIAEYARPALAARLAAELDRVADASRKAERSAV